MTNYFIGFFARLAVLMIIFGHMYRPEVVLPVPAALVISLIFMFAGGEGFKDNE